MDVEPKKQQGPDMQLIIFGYCSFRWVSVDTGFEALVMERYIYGED